MIFIPSIASTSTSSASSSMAARLLLCSQTYNYYCGTSSSFLLQRPYSNTHSLLLLPHRHRHISGQPQPALLLSPGTANIHNNYISRVLLPLPVRAGSQDEDGGGREIISETENGDAARFLLRLQSTSLFLLTGVYVLWLFLLPYAPGDPVWAIKLDTINMLLDFSLNFLYILPLSNWCDSITMYIYIMFALHFVDRLVGFHFLESPVVHPTAEALFNFVMGWSILFAPLLFTDTKSRRFKGSLLLLWGVQMFLTNTVLIPYMAIRLQEEESASKKKSRKPSVMEEMMTSPNGGAKLLSVMGGVIGWVSVWWFLSGRGEESFGDLTERWTFFVEYVGSDRPGYAFIWDICLYTLFQPWLIGDNLDNIDRDKAGIVRLLRFIPYIGLVAYLWTLARNPNLDPQSE